MSIGGSETGSLLDGKMLSYSSNYPPNVEFQSWVSEVRGGREGRSNMFNLEEADREFGSLASVSIYASSFPYANPALWL